MTVGDFLPPWIPRRCYLAGQRRTSLALPDLPTLLSPRISFWVNPIVDKVTRLLMPALPKLVKTQVSGIGPLWPVKAAPPVGLGWNCKLVLRG